MAILSKRNIIITAFSIASCFSMLCFIAFLFFLSKDLSQTFLELLFEPNIVIPIFTILFSFLSAYLIKKFFSRNTRAEILFFLVFLLTLNFDGAKSIAFIFQELKYPMIYMNYLTKAAYFGKIMGIFSLMSFALMTLESDHKPFTTMFGITMLISFMITIGMPLSPEMGSNNMFFPGQNIFKIFIITVMIITLLILIMNFLQQKNYEYLYLVVSIMLIYVGNWTLFFTANYLYAFLGMCFLTAGTIFISYRIHKLYLWM